MLRSPIIGISAAYALLSSQRRLPTNLASSRSMVEAPVHVSLTHDRLKELHNCDLDNGGRIILVGDVHGCADELDLLLKHVGFRKGGGDLVVLLGDVVNKGPKSVEAVRLARSVGALALRGNHDDAAIAASVLRRQDARASPLYLPTLPPHLSAMSARMTGDYLARWSWVDGLAPEEGAWLASLPYSISLPFPIGEKFPQGVLLVHAGVVPGRALEDQSLKDLTHMRNLAIIGDDGCATEATKQNPAGKQHPQYLALEKDEAGSVGWATMWQGPQHIFFGHDAKRRLQQEEYATGLDTGCLYGGSLSAAILPGGEIESVCACATHVKPSR